LSYKRSPCNYREYKNEDGICGKEMINKSIKMCSSFINTELHPYNYREYKHEEIIYSKILNSAKDLVQNGPIVVAHVNNCCNNLEMVIMMTSHGA
jgi:hypothetical protein